MFQFKSILKSRLLGSKTNSKSVFSLFFFSFVFLFISTAFAESQLVCDDSRLYQSAYRLLPHQIRTLNSDLTLNKNVNDNNKKKLSRIVDAINIRTQDSILPKWYTKKGKKYVADNILWASNCTGNDFTVLSAILSVESGYCTDITGGGSDSGCSQLSVRKGASVHEMKSQLNITGGDGQAVPEVTTTLRAMVYNCLGQDDAEFENFLKFYSRDFNSIKTDLRSAKNIPYDILMGALYLKFKTSLAGAYILPGKSKGGIALYNSGGDPNYMKKIEGKGSGDGRLHEMSGVCYEDHYTPEVLTHACELLGLEGDICNSVKGIAL